MSNWRWLVTQKNIKLLWSLPEPVIISLLYSFPFRRQFRPHRLAAESKFAVVVLYLFKLVPSVVVGLKAGQLQAGSKYFYLSLPNGKRKVLVSEPMRGFAEKIQALRFLHKPDALLFPNMISSAKRKGRTDSGRRLCRIIAKIVKNATQANP